MQTSDQYFAFGVAMLVIGGVLSFVVGPWYLGVGFLLLGAHRIYLGFSTKNKDEATSSSKE